MGRLWGLFPSCVTFAEKKPIEILAIRYFEWVAERA